MLHFHNISSLSSWSLKILIMAWGAIYIAELRDF